MSNVKDVPQAMHTPKPIQAYGETEISHVQTILPDRQKASTLKKYPRDFRGGGNFITIGQIALKATDIKNEFGTLPAFESTNISTPKAYLLEENLKEMADIICQAVEQALVKINPEFEFLIELNSVSIGSVNVFLTIKAKLADIDYKGYLSEIKKGALRKIGGALAGAGMSYLGMNFVAVGGPVLDEATCYTMVRDNQRYEVSCELVGTELKEGTYYITSQNDTLSEIAVFIKNETETDFSIHELQLAIYEENKAKFDGSMDRLKINEALYIPTVEETKEILS
jgi:hypothetical protein